MIIGNAMQAATTLASAVGDVEKNLNITPPGSPMSTDASTPWSTYLFGAGALAGTICSIAMYALNDKKWLPVVASLSALSALATYMTKDMTFIKSLSANVDHLALRVRQFAPAVLGLTKAAEKFEESKSELEETIKGHEIEEKRLISELEAINQKLSASTAKFESIVKERARLSKDLEKATKGLEAYRTYWKGMESKLTGVALEVDRFSNLEKEMEDDADKIEEHADEIKDHVSAFDGENEELRQHTEKLDALISGLAKKMQEALKAHRDLLQQKRKLEKEIQQLDETDDKVEKSAGDVKAAANELGETSDEIKDAVQDTKELLKLLPLIPVLKEFNGLMKKHPNTDPRALLEQMMKQKEG